jgi:hypothetical protein
MPAFSLDADGICCQHPKRKLASVTDISPYNREVVIHMRAELCELGMGQKMVVLQEISKNKVSREQLCLFSLSNHSEQRGDQCHLAAHIAFVHPLHLPLSYHVQDLESL